MSLAKKVALNTSLDVVGRVFQLLISSISIIILTRYLGPEGYGFYALILAFIGMFSDISGLGINMTIARQIPNQIKRIGQIFSNALSLKIFTSTAIFGLAVIIGVLIYPQADLRTGIVLAGLSSFFLSIQAVYKPIFQIKLRLKNFVLADIISRAAGFALLLLFVYLGYGLNYLIATLTISSIINFILTDLFARKLINFKIRINLEGWRRLIGQAFFVALVVILAGLSQKIATVIISKVLGAQEVGIFELALRPILIIHGVGLLSVGLIYPIIAKLLKQSREKLYQIISQTNYYFQYAGIILALITFFLSQEIVLILGGTEFLEASLVLKILSGALLLRFLALSYQNLSIAKHKEKQVILCYLLGITVIVLGTIFLAPIYGVLGAAWSFLAGELLTSLSILIVAREDLLPSGFLSSLAKNIHIYLILGLALYLTDRYLLETISFNSLNIVARIGLIMLISTLALSPLLVSLRKKLTTKKI